MLLSSRNEHSRYRRQTILSRLDSQLRSLLPNFHNLAELEIAPRLQLVMITSHGTPIIKQTRMKPMPDPMSSNHSSPSSSKPHSNAHVLHLQTHQLLQAFLMAFKYQVVGILSFDHSFVFKHSFVSRASQKYPVEVVLEQYPFHKSFN